MAEPPPLLDVVCGDDGACRVDSSEPLPLKAAHGRPHLVRTSVLEEAAESRGWGADFPTYWIVILDDRDHVLAAQRLATGFKRGQEPDSDSLWSTFQLTLPSESDRLVTLRVWEPSPSGTAWGRDGFVRFSWPRFEPIEWEYHAFHFLNPSLNSTERWTWLDQTGSSQYRALQFQFLLPRVEVEIEVLECLVMFEVGTPNSLLELLGFPTLCLVLEEAIEKFLERQVVVYCLAHSHFEREQESTEAQPLQKLGQLVNGAHRGAP